MKIPSGTVHTLPADLKAALAASPKALAKWEDITPLARNEWICWTISVKTPETRKDHVRRVVSELIEEYVGRAVGSAASTARTRR